MIKTHHFQVDDAVLYGVEKAVLLNNLKYWLDHAKANGKKAIDGYHWTFNSATSFAELIPYIDSRKIGRLMRELEADGIIIVGNHNRAGYDRTKWYTMPEYALQAASPVIVQNVTVDCQNMDNALSQFEQPIPDINTDNKHDNKQLVNIKYQFDFKNLGWPEIPDLELYQDWLKMRKKVKASTTERALKTIGKELTKALANGFSVNECLETAEAAGWKGFKSHFMKRSTDNFTGQQVALPDQPLLNSQGKSFDQLMGEVIK